MSRRSPPLYCTLTLIGMQGHQTNTENTKQKQCSASNRVVIIYCFVAFNAVAFQFPVMPNVRMSLWTQSVYSLSLSYPVLSVLQSRFPKTIRLGSRPPLIRRSVPAHKNLPVRNVVSMLSHPVIPWARLYEVIRWSGLLRCAPMIRSVRMYLPNVDDYWNIMTNRIHGSFSSRSTIRIWEILCSV